jgi:hypothetical protein
MIEMLGFACCPFLDRSLYCWPVDNWGGLRQAQEILNQQQIGCDVPESRHRISFAGAVLQIVLALLQERARDVALPRLAAAKKLIEQG